MEKDDGLVIYNTKLRDPRDWYIKSVTVRKPKPLEETLEGREIITREEALQQAAPHLTPGEPALEIGGVPVDSKTHVAIIGRSQFGKSQVMLLGMSKALVRVANGSGEKLIIFDDDGDIVSFVYAHLGDKAPVYILNPEDERCHALDFASIADSASTVRDVSKTLIVDSRHGNDFFDLAARSALSGEIDSHILTEAGKPRRKRSALTLRDIVCGAISPERIKTLLERHPELLRRVWKAFIDRPNQDVFATIQAKMEDFTTVAALWDKRPLFNLREFLDSPKGGVLILSPGDENKTTVEAINRLVVERAAKILLKGPKIQGPRYWFYLDEFTELGNLETLRKLMKRGLKRGIRVILALHNHDDVRHVYGDTASTLLLSECGTFFLFRLNSITSEFAAKIIGQAKKRRWARNQGWNVGFGKNNQVGGGTTNTFGSGPGGPSSSVSYNNNWSKSDSIQFGFNRGKQEHILFEWVVSPALVDTLKVGEFYCITDTVEGTWKFKYPWEEIKPIVTLKSEKPEHAPFIPRRKKRGQKIPYDYLRPWDRDDLERLGLPLDLLDDDESTKAKSPNPKDGKQEDLKQEHKQKATQEDEDTVGDFNRKWGQRRT